MVHGDEAPSSTSHHVIQWNPLAKGLRRQYDDIYYNPPLVQDPHRHGHMIPGPAITVSTTSVHGFTYNWRESWSPSEYLYQFAAIHELRHVWQYSLTKVGEGGYPDVDVDALPDPTDESRVLPASGRAVWDAGFAIGGSPGATANTDFNFRAEELPTQPPLPLSANERFVRHHAFERDAMRYQLAFDNYTPDPDHPGMPPQKAECTLGEPRATSGVTGSEDDRIQGTLDGDPVILGAYVPLDSEGTTFIGGLPLRWSVEDPASSPCRLLLEGSGSPLTTAVPFMETLATPSDDEAFKLSDNAMWASEISVLASRAGTCQVMVEMLAPVASYPSDCPSPGATTFFLRFQ